MTKKMQGFIYFLFVCFSLHAQTSIEGRVITMKGEPIADANVVLLGKDSLFVSGASTNGKGKFVLKNVNMGDHRLRVSNIGYIPVFIKLIGGKTNLDLDDIVMFQDTIGLNEVVVEGRNKIRGMDKDIVFPTKHQLKYSTNGLTLLQQLDFPRLSVDFVNNSVSVNGGGEVLLCINGRPASNVEVIALRPEDIQRVEYYDRFSVRYGMKTVVDYIVRMKETGGVIALDLTDEPFTAQGQNVLVAKLNHKKSEWGILYDQSFANREVKWKEHTTYRYPDNVIEREKKSEKNRIGSQSHDITFSYANQEIGKYYFYAALTNNIYRTPRLTPASVMTTDNQDGMIRINDTNRTKQYTPALSLYLQKNLQKNQMIIFNLVGTYINGEDQSSSTYWNDALLTDALNLQIKNRKYSLIGQGAYEKAWNTMKLSTGIKYVWNKVLNNYSGDVLNDFRTTYNMTELGWNFMGNKNRFGYFVAGVVQYNGIRQMDQYSKKFTYRLSGALRYNYTENAYLSYQLNIMRDHPSLSSLNDVETSVNDIERQRGNASLKPYQQYMNVFVFTYNKKWFYADVMGSYTCMPKPAMEQTLYENGYFVRTEDNQKRYQAMEWGANFRFTIWKDYLRATVSPTWFYAVSDGNYYSHNRSVWSYRGELMGTYKSWMLLFQINSASGALLGETLGYGTNADRLMLMYKYKYLALSAGISNFLGRDYRFNEEFKYAYLISSHKWSSGITNRFFFKLSYTLPFGRQKSFEERKYNNQERGDGIINQNKIM